MEQVYFRGFRQDIYTHNNGLREWAVFFGFWHPGPPVPHLSHCFSQMLWSARDSSINLNRVADTYFKACPPSPESSKFLRAPQKPQKDTLGSGIGPRKVIFGHFTFYIDILAPFLECKQLCKPRMPNFAVDLWSDLDSENCSEISAVTSLGICLLFFPFPTFVFFTPPYCVCTIQCVLVFVGVAEFMANSWRHPQL